MITVAWSKALRQSRGLVGEAGTGKPFRFEDRGRVTLQGLPEPAQIYSVLWREESE